MRKRWITYRDQTLTLSAWATLAGLRPQTLASRLDRGLPVDRALATGICDRRECALRSRDASSWGGPGSQA